MRSLETSAVDDVVEAARHFFSSVAQGKDFDRAEYDAKRPAIVQGLLTFADMEPDKVRAMAARALPSLRSLATQLSRVAGMSDEEVRLTTRKVLEALP